MNLLELLTGVNRPNAGLAQQGINVNALYPVWKEKWLDAQMQGVAFPTFQEWAGQQGLTIQGAMPRMQGY